MTFIYSVKFEELHSRHPEDIAVLHAYAVHEGKMHNVSASRELFGKCTTFHDEGEELSNHLVWQVCESHRLFLSSNFTVVVMGIYGAS